MKKLLFALLLVCLFCTCRKDNYSNSCGGKNPIQNLSWLKAKIDIKQKNASHSSITRIAYKNQTYFLEFNECCPSCNCVAFLVYDCEGNSLFNLYPELYPEVVNNHLPQQTIWQK